MKQPSFNITYKTGLFLLLFACMPLTASVSQAALPDNPLPSDQTLNDIQHQTTPSTRDWWDEGPPEGGDGGGSFVGAPISKSKAAVPVSLASLVYLLIRIRKKKKK